MFLFNLIFIFLRNIISFFHWSDEIVNQKSLVFILFVRWNWLLLVHVYVSKVHFCYSESISCVRRFENSQNTKLRRTMLWLRVFLFGRTSTINTQIKSDIWAHVGFLVPVVLMYIYIAHYVEKGIMLTLGRFCLISKREICLAWCWK